MFDIQVFISAKDIKPSFRWATKNKFRWFTLMIIMMPVYIFAGFLEGLKVFVEEYSRDFFLKDVGYWHKKENK